MRKKRAAGAGILDKADDAPELTDAFFAAATVRQGNKVVCRGRPKVAAPIDQVGAEKSRRQGTRLRRPLRAGAPPEIRLSGSQGRSPSITRYRTARPARAGAACQN